MKNFTIGLILLLCSTSTFASNKMFQKYAALVLKSSAKPTKMITESTILILHPLIKQKESKYLFTSKLSWKGDNCTAKVTSLQTIKGKEPRRESSLRKAHKFYYIPQKLKKLLSRAGISNWRKASNIKLEKKRVPGYRFSAFINGIKREAAFGIKNGAIEAIVLGFPNTGISHAKNMKDSGTIWYFKKNKTCNLTLIRSFSLMAKKSNGVPFVKRTEINYSNF